MNTIIEADTDRLVNALEAVEACYQVIQSKELMDARYWLITELETRYPQAQHLVTDWSYDESDIRSYVDMLADAINIVRNR
jgi:hypothetical protein